jgi:hypothetical protein
MMAQPEIVRILNLIKKEEQLVATGEACTVTRRNLALAKCTYWRMRKLKLITT